MLFRSNVDHNQTGLRSDKHKPPAFVSNMAASDLWNGHPRASTRALSGCIRHQRGAVRRSVYRMVVDMTRDLPKSWYSAKLTGLRVPGTRL